MFKGFWRVPFRLNHSTSPSRLSTGVDSQIRAHAFAPACPAA